MVYALNLNNECLKLNNSEKKVIEKCINRYSLKGSFKEKIIKIIYRIINIWKSLFNHSEWQVAKQIISTKIICNFKIRNFQLLTKDEKQLIDDYADCLMKIYFLNNEKRKIPKKLEILQNTLKQNIYAKFSKNQQTSSFIISSFINGAIGSALIFFFVGFSISHVLMSEGFYSCKEVSSYNYGMPAYLLNNAPKDHPCHEKANLLNKTLYNDNNSTAYYVAKIAIIVIGILSSLIKGKKRELLSSKNLAFTSGFIASSVFLFNAKIEEKIKNYLPIMPLIFLTSSMFVSGIYNKFQDKCLNRKSEV